MEFVHVPKSTAIDPELEFSGIGCAFPDSPQRKEFGVEVGENVEAHELGIEEVTSREREELAPWPPRKDRSPKSSDKKRLLPLIDFERVTRSEESIFSDLCEIPSEISLPEDLSSLMTVQSQAKHKGYENLTGLVIDDHWVLLGLRSSSKHIQQYFVQLKSLPHSQLRCFAANVYYFGDVPKPVVQYRRREVKRFAKSHFTLWTGYQDNKAFVIYCTSDFLEEMQALDNSVTAKEQRRIKQQRRRQRRRAFKRDADATDAHLYARKASGSPDRASIDGNIDETSSDYNLALLDISRTSWDARSMSDNDLEISKCQGCSRSGQGCLKSEKAWLQCDDFEFTRSCKNGERSTVINEDLIMKYRELKDDLLGLLARMQHQSDVLEASC